MLSAHATMVSGAQGFGGGGGDAPRARIISKRTNNKEGLVDENLRSGARGERYLGRHLGPIFGAFVVRCLRRVRKRRLARWQRVGGERFARAPVGSRRCCRHLGRETPNHLGFGAAAVFWAADITQQQAEFFFSQPKGLGLSLVRVSAKSYQDNNGSLTTMPTYCPELETAKKAQALGARVWAASWTPPPAWKTNGAINGKPMAHLQPSHYADFAQSLATFATSMTAQGVPLFGIYSRTDQTTKRTGRGACGRPKR